MYEKEFNKIYSQIDLPFQETKQVFLKMIFKTLEREFDLQKNSKQIFIDLGSGNGQVIIYSAINYGIRSIGIEIDPILIKEAKMSIKSFKDKKKINKKALSKIKIIHGDFYKHNLKFYDFIYIYSLPSMQKFLNHVFVTAKKGALVISHKYQLENLNSYLKYENRLEHKKDNQKVFTYFYRKFS